MVKLPILILTFIACALLIACSPNTVFEPREVDVPVAVKCSVKPPEKPVWNFSRLSASSPLTDMVKAALADNELRDGYIGEIEAALKACNDGDGE